MGEENPSQIRMTRRKKMVELEQNEWVLGAIVFICFSPFSSAFANHSFSSAREICECAHSRVRRPRAGASAAAAAATVAAAAEDER